MFLLDYEFNELNTLGIVIRHHYLMLFATLEKQMFEKTCFV